MNNKVTIPGQNPVQKTFFDPADELQVLKNHYARQKTSPYSSEIQACIVDLLSARFEADSTQEAKASKKLQGFIRKSREEERIAHFNSLRQDDLDDLELPSAGFKPIDAYAVPGSIGLEEDDLEFADDQNSPVSAQTLQVMQGLVGLESTIGESTILTEQLDLLSQEALEGPSEDTGSLEQESNEQTQNSPINYKDPVRLEAIDRKAQAYIDENTVPAHLQEMAMKEMVCRKFAVSMITRALLDYLQPKDEALSKDAESWFLDELSDSVTSYTNMASVLEGMPSRGVDLIDAVDERPIDCLNSLLRAFKEIDSAENAHVKSNENRPRNIVLETYRSRASY